MTSNTRPSPLFVALMPCPAKMPSLALLSGLTEEVRARAASFKSERRQIEFLWSRLMIREMLSAMVPGVKVPVRERPPQSPVIESNPPVLTSVAHTKTFIAVSMGVEPSAVDVEVLNEKRAVAAIWERCFPMTLWQKTPEKERLKKFYSLWGLRECAVKLGGTLEEVSPDECRITVAGQIQPHRFVPLEKNTLLTIAGKGAKTALIVRMTEREIYAIRGKGTVS